MLHLLESGPEGMLEWNRQRTEFPRAPGLNEELRKRDLRGADLSGFDLRELDLSGANLLGASLRGANLAGANLSGAKLMLADLGSANLSGAQLGSVDLSGAQLDGASCEGARLGMTKLVAVNLSPLCAVLPSLHHDAKSEVDHRSMAKSVHAPELRAFLRATGLPVSILAYLVDSIEALPPNELLAMTQSTFISHAVSDREFAGKLNDELFNRGVAAFYFASDPAPRKLRQEVPFRLDKHDRLLLICSKASLLRPEVKHEIAAALEREARDGATYLFPVLTDPSATQEWEAALPDVRGPMRERGVDFQGTAGSDAGFTNAVERLVDRLQTIQPGSSTPA